MQGSENRKPAVCLGIEGTAHTFGVALVDSSGKTLADVNDFYVPPSGKGIHPRECSQHHSLVAAKLLTKALQDSDVKPDGIDAVAFSQGPGMGPCLRTAATMARALSVFLHMPLIGVNHVVAHIEIGKLVNKAEDPLVLVLSGGTTQILALEEGRYRVFGETLDITAANCLDVFAREAGLHDPKAPWPAYVFDKMADGGESYISLPYTVKGMDLQFSGILTAALAKHREGKYRLEDLCFSLRETVLAMITEVAERALAHTRKAEVLLIGGMAQKARLREMLSIMAEEHEARFLVVPNQYATDNAAMIAWTGILAYKAGQTLTVERSLVKPKWRVDQVSILW